MASALSLNEFRINRLEFNSGVTNGHLPVDDTVPCVGVGVPRLGFLSELSNRPEPPPFDALASHGTQLVFSNVQPASMFGGVA